MTIEFGTGDGSLDVEPDPKAKAHAAFLADLVTPNSVTLSGQALPEHVTAAKDVNREAVERLVSHMEGLNIVDAA